MLSLTCIISYFSGMNPLLSHKPKQSHLILGKTHKRGMSLREEMDKLTETLLEVSEIEQIREKVWLTLSYENKEEFEARREIGNAKDALYQKLLDDIEKILDSWDTSILFQVPLSHAADFIPYIIERKHNPESVFYRMQVDYTIIDTASIEKVSHDEEHLQMLYDAYIEQIRWVDRFVQIVDTWDAASVFVDDTQRKKSVKAVTKKFTDTLTEINTKRQNKLRLYFPSVWQAEKEGMSLRDFYILSQRAASLDWERIKEANEELVELFRTRDVVEIKWKYADIRFDISGMWARNSVIQTNWPGSEVHSAPAREWVDGWIVYNNPIYIPFLWKDIQGIRLEFQKGKLIQFEILWEYKDGEKEKITQELEERLSEEEGNRYIWELAFGTNFFVPVGIKHTLIGEKALGMHIALWKSYSYPEVDNKNNESWGVKTSIHWDIIRWMNDDTVVSFIQKDGEEVQVMKDWRFQEDVLPQLASYQREIEKP